MKAYNYKNGERKHVAIRRLWVPTHIYDGWSLKRIADHWECSLDSIYRDVNQLKADGLIT